MTKQRLKVAWICHFSNHSVREHLPIRVNTLESLLRRMLKKRPKKVSSDFAPWVTNMAKEFETVEGIELDIISPHFGLAVARHSFACRGIRYHFFKPDTDYLLVKGFRRLFGIQRPAYRLNRRRISRFVDKIKPDVIVLIGAENPYYSISALDISGIPVILIAQTVYTNPDRQKHSGQVDRYRWDLELEIHRKLKFFSCNARIHRDLILRNNPEAIVFRHRFPYIRPRKLDNPFKEYNFVFFAAGVSKKKGIEDAIQAIGIVKKQYPEVSLDVVGKCDPEHKSSLVEMINKHGVAGNIVFHEYFPKQSDMHDHIQKARYALLPVKLDSIPGTIAEAMMLDLPVVSYITSGTPRLNKYGEAVLLCEINDVEALAKNMIRVMDEPDLVDRLISNSRKYVEIEIDNDRSANNFVRMFYAVYENYHRQVPIPKDLLFDPKEFPIYTREVSI